MSNYGKRRGSSEQPFFPKGEIDQICTDVLAAAGLLPSKPAPIRVERFVEKHFGVTPSYEDTPDGVLGFTRFGAKGVEDIVLSKALDSDGSRVAERRIRTTIAHEAGHGLLHADLFGPSTAQSDFADFSQPQRPRILCRDIVEGEAPKTRRYDGRWWEFQANQAIGGLLLPLSLVQSALEPFLVGGGLLGNRYLDEKRRGEAARTVSEAFDVNPQVAKIRIEQMFPQSNVAQLEL